MIKYYKIPTTQTHPIPCLQTLLSWWKGQTPLVEWNPSPRPCECLPSFSGSQAAALHFPRSFSCSGIYQEHLLNNLEGSRAGAISVGVSRELLSSAESTGDEAVPAASGGCRDLGSSVVSDAERLGAELTGIMFLWMDVPWSPGLERDGEHGSLERHKQLEPQCWVLTEAPAMSVAKKQRAGTFTSFPLKLILYLEPFLHSLTHCWHFWGPQRVSSSVQKKLKSKKMIKGHSWNVNPFCK